jgi:ferric-dicitrate binding protein FerR (iron transport regulator)
LEQTTNPEEEKQLNDWLTENHENVELYCQLQSIWDSGKVSEKEKDFSKRKWEELHKLISGSKSKSKQKLYFNWTSYAAAIFLVLLIASIAVNFIFHPQKETLIEQIQSIQNVVFNHNGVQKLVLPDSSVVWLNDRTKFSYPGEFNTDKRVVSMEGNVFFEVQKNEVQPFVVQAGKVDVAVTGTTFFVETETEKNTLVALVSGGVTVYVKNEEGAVINSAKLIPGQQAKINKANNLLSVTTVDISYYVAWKDGTYRFVDEPLSIIAKQLSHRYNMKIVLSPSVKNKRFTGRIAPGQNINAIMKIINETHPVKYRIEKEIIYINEK